MSAGRIPTTANSPLTTKGDLFGYSTQPARITAGANNTVLMADSTAATGLKYAMAASLATSAKTVSYVLVATDAGTRVTMNSASATTVTINSGLFAANDVVEITNLGVGVLTITAGTATVSTAGVLTLAQNASGSLYFTSTGVSIWQGSAAAASSSTSYALLNSGGTALTAAATITVSGLSAFNKFFILIDQAGSDTASSTISLRFNSDSASNYYPKGQRINLVAVLGSANFTRYNGALSNWQLAVLANNASSTCSGYVSIDGAKTTGLKFIQSVGAAAPASGTDNQSYYLGGYWDNTATISSISVLSSAGNFNAGTMFIYGAN